jgi:hypothetical protein
MRKKIQNILRKKLSRSEGKKGHESKEMERGEGKQK